MSPINKASFLGAIKKGVSNMANSSANPFHSLEGIPAKIITMKGKMDQNKIIRNYVDRQPSKLAPENRSMSNTIRESENLDAKIKSGLKKKGIY